MNERLHAGALVVSALLAVGCAKGTETPPVALTNGEYQLLTVGLEGTCSLQDAISPGTEHVGKVARVLTHASTNSVTIEPCDPFFESECFTTTTDGNISLIRNDYELRADDPNWQVPSCTCFDAYTASRSVTGTIVDDDRVELTWTFEAPQPPADCLCTGAGWQACQATVSQLLTRP
jgi:hypothetical protein